MSINAQHMVSSTSHSTEKSLGLVCSILAQNKKGKTEVGKTKREQGTQFFEHFRSNFCYFHPSFYLWSSFRNFYSCCFL